MRTSTYLRVSAVFAAITSLSLATVRADVVLDWNAVIRDVIQTDGILNSPALANPGWSTRTMAMTNGAMYDAFQSVNRTHAPFLYTQRHPGVSKEAAAAQAAYDILLDCYPLRQSILDVALTATLGSVPDGQMEDDGVALGHAIAARYISERLNDGSDVLAPWPEGAMPGEWRSDPLHAPQSAWGPAWGAVQSFVPGTGSIPVPGPPPLNDPDPLGAYKVAYDMVEDYGALATYGPMDTPTSRTDDQTEIGLFWAYDRPSMGPPPVLFLQNVNQIAAEVGSSAEDNARLFAIASVAMADAAIAAWDVKFADNFWRPITGIREGDADTNSYTVGDPDWVPLGAPGSIPNDPNNPNDPMDPLGEDDFTPPFPAYTSGHATMGGAVFKAIALFYETNSFSEADNEHGVDMVDPNYDLNSAEFGVDMLPGMTRTYDKFTQEGLIDVGTENSPEGENAMSRIYLGIHWIFDQRDGTYLGNDIAGYVYARFQAVPEPGTIALAALGVLGIAGLVRRNRRQ